MAEIADDDLLPEHVPDRNAPWHPTIAEFALTYDGYAAMGNRIFSFAERRFDRWREDGSLPRELRHLRACLFIEQRSIRWAENGPSPRGRPTSSSPTPALRSIESEG